MPSSEKGEDEEIKDSSLLELPTQFVYLSIITLLKNETLVMLHGLLAQINTSIERSTDIRQNPCEFPANQLDWINGKDHESFLEGPGILKSSCRSLFKLTGWAGRHSDKDDWDIRCSLLRLMDSILMTALGKFSIAFLKNNSHEFFPFKLSQIHRRAN